MRIYTCTSCRYTFRYPAPPSACPDCGRQTVRIATMSEVKKYNREQALLAREIRLGLYPAAG